MTRRIVYLSYDGLCESLGFSQVARVVVGLARLGFRYHVVSFERAAHLADRRRIDEVARYLESAGVTWERHAYATGGARAAPSNVSRALSSLLAGSAETSLVHARSYVAASVARLTRVARGIPYLFDARATWLAERSEDGGALTRPGMLQIARAGERALYGGAAGVVTLTELHREDVVRGRFGRWQGAPTLTVPTCADYDEFVLREDRPGPPPDPRLAGRFVVAMIGSINASYLTRDALRLVADVLGRRDDAVLLFATPQTELATSMAAGAAIDRERLVVRAIPHAEMATWTRHVDVAVQLLVETPAKRGSMPTKLAEFFAAGVRPVHLGCSAEVSDWVRRAGSGLVLDGIVDLDRAAAWTAGIARDVSVLRRAREATRGHFSLASGIERYAALLEQLLSRRT